MEISRKHLKLIAEALDCYELDILKLAVELEEKMESKAYSSKEPQRLHSEAMAKCGEISSLKQMVDELILRE